MATTRTTASDWLIETLRGTIVATVRRDGADLTARQLGVFLICYRESEPQTVRELAKTLNISKPAISRALDRLEGHKLLRRKTDPHDGRSVLMIRTPAGKAFFRELKQIMAKAAEEAKQTARRGE